MRAIALVAAALAMVCGPSALADDAGKVTGTLEVAGKTIPLKHVLALKHENEEGMLDGPELRLLFTDEPVAPALLGSPLLSTLDALAREGKLRGVLLRFDPAKHPREVHGTVYHSPSSPQASMAFFTLSGEEAGFRSLETTDGRAKGKASYEASGKADSDPSLRFSYTVDFDAPVRENAAITARLKDEEAQKSPQAAAVLAFEKTMRAGDIPASRKYATKRRNEEIDSIISVMGKDFLLKQAREFIPEESVRRKQVVEVIERGDHAIVVFVNDGAREPAPVVKQGEVWLVE